MPGTYRCPKGDKHQWKTERQGNVVYRVCQNCGQKKVVREVKTTR